MIITNEHAMLDNDFWCKIWEINFQESEKIRIIEQVSRNLNKRFIMHTLVYNNELLEKYKVKPIFDDGIVVIAQKEDILQEDSTLEEYYRRTFEDLYFELTGNSLYNGNYTNIWEEWIHGKSLGEVHCITTCCICECDLFLSDDEDSKTLSKLVKNIHDITVHVWTREEMLYEISKEGLNKRIRRSIGHKR